MDARSGFFDSARHIRAELAYLDLLLRRALVVARANRPSGDAPAFRGLLITDEALDRVIDAPALDDASASAVARLDAEIDRRRKEIDARVAASGGAFSLARLAQRCGLNAAEMDIVLIALAPELDARYETIYAYLQDDVTRARPEVSLALSLLWESLEERNAARALFAPSAPLLRLRLLELGESAHDRRPTLLRRFLKLDESALAFLLEQPPCCAPGVEIATAEAAPQPNVSAQTQNALDALARRLIDPAPDGDLIQMFGDAAAPLREAACYLGWRLQRPLQTFDAGALCDNPALAGAILRDAILWRAIPVLRRADAGDATPQRAEAQAAEAQLLARLGEAGATAIMLGGADAHRFPPRARLWRVAIEPPDAVERFAFWSEAAPDAPEADRRRLADMFPFGADGVRQALGLAATTAALRDPASPEPVMGDLVAAGRALAAPNLRRFAQLVTPRYDWDDLVLPDDRKRQLRSVVGRVSNRGVVQENWGFGKKLARGRGVAVLFSGPPGSGKTMAAEVLARALSLQLFQIDLSTVASKYVGEAEKQLAAIFAEAERSQCMLFFDECDAIFGKRTEVKDAHDRYANTEVNYLLQRLEQYDGVVLLATNFQKNIDDAFMRRLHDSIDFPMPDEAAREEIWRKQFPKEAPIDSQLDFAFLAAKLKLPGANIRNAALAAAYLAAQESGNAAIIRMEHVLEAARREFQKQGKLVMASDMGIYSDLKIHPETRRGAQA